MQDPNDPECHASYQDLAPTLQIQHHDAQAYVTGLRAANNVMAVLKRGGQMAEISALEPEEPHVLAMRQAIRLGQQLQSAAEFSPLRDLIPSVVR